MSVDADAVLGELLGRARRLRGLTCDEAVRMSAMSGNRLAGIEGGDGLLYFADILPLLAAYRLSLGEFATWMEAELVRREATAGRAEGGRPGRDGAGTGSRRATPPTRAAGAGTR